MILSKAQVQRGELRGEALKKAWAHHVAEDARRERRQHRRQLREDLGLLGVLELEHALDDAQRADGPRGEEGALQERGRVL